MTPPPARQPLWLVVLLIGSATIGMHVFVPALPLLTDEFGIDPARAQLTISVYMFVIAGGQLLYGPLSDRYGRRPILIGALAVFVIAGIAAALAASFEALLAARMLQAGGGCAGMVLGRAIVHDTAQGAEAARRIALANAALLVSPILSPVAGVWLTGAFGWRAIPLALALLGLIAGACAVFALTETVRARPEPLVQALARYRALLRRRPFLLHVLGGSLTTATMFVLLTASPFVMERLGRPFDDMALFYAAFLIGLMAGNLTSGGLAQRFGPDRVFVIAPAIGTAGAGLMLVLLLAGRLNAPTFLLSGVMYTFMTGLMAPLSQTRAVALSPDLRGSAVGIFGAAQFVFGAAGVTIASHGTDVPLIAAAVLFVCALSGLCLYAAIRPRAHS